MKTLVVGSGGREHALAWRLSKDPLVDEVFAAPGNPGIAEVAKCVAIDPTRIEELANFAKEQKIDLTVVGPEQPLALGIVDAFREKDLRIFGPDRDSARVESSKTYARELCGKYRIPSPKWQVFDNAQDASGSLEDYGPPWVVKADGLAAGKGTTVTRNRSEAKEAIVRESKRPPGRVILEVFVDGWEATFMATVSGDKVQWLTPVFQDYKPVYDNDTGPNTGGMGCYSPVPAVSNQLVERVRNNILNPMVDALRREGTHYQGVLNLNAIVSHETESPYVLEFNARFGDPEGQGVMMLVEDGLAEHLSQVADNDATTNIPKCSSGACVLVVVASKGYPTSQSIGDKIVLRPVMKPNVKIFQAGTTRDQTGGLVTAGGRVLNVAATGQNVESAKKDAYETIQNAVDFEGMHYRSDIGSSDRHGRPLQVTRTH